MANTYGKQDVQCPFYKYDDAQAVVCEGPVDGSTTKVRFRTKSRKENYRRRHCEKDYETCSVCKMLYKKYS